MHLRTRVVLATLAAVGANKCGAAHSDGDDGGFSAAGKRNERRRRSNMQSASLRLQVT